MWFEILLSYREKHLGFRTRREISYRSSSPPPLSTFVGHCYLRERREWPQCTRENNRPCCVRAWVPTMWAPNVRAAEEVLWKRNPLSYTPPPPLPPGQPQPSLQQLAEYSTRRGTEPGIKYHE